MNLSLARLTKKFCSGSEKLLLPVSVQLKLDKSCILAPTFMDQVLSFPTMFSNPLPNFAEEISCEWENCVQVNTKMNPIRANFLVLITVLVFVAANNRTQC